MTSIVMDFLYVPFNICHFCVYGMYVLLSTTVIGIYMLISNILMPLIQVVVMTCTYLMGFILLSICLLMGPALKSVPSEASFNQWVQQFVKLADPELPEPATGYFASVRNRITNSVNQTLSFYLIMSNFTIQFLFFGFMRVAVCTNKSNPKERYIFVGIFNTWIPTPF
jgi:hypothetical protein